jgi:hypothetical protein
MPEFKFIGKKSSKDYPLKKFFLSEMEKIQRRGHKHEAKQKLHRATGQIDKAFDDIARLAVYSKCFQQVESHLEKYFAIKDVDPGKKTLDEALLHNILHVIQATESGEPGTIQNDGELLQSRGSERQLEAITHLDAAIQAIDELEGFAPDFHLEKEFERVLHVLDEQEEVLGAALHEVGQAIHITRSLDVNDLREEIKATDEKLERCRRFLRVVRERKIANAGDAAQLRALQEQLKALKEQLKALPFSEQHRSASSPAISRV